MQHWRCCRAMLDAGKEHHIIAAAHRSHGSTQMTSHGETTDSADQRRFRRTRSGWVYDFVGATSPPVGRSHHMIARRSRRLTQISSQRHKAITRPLLHQSPILGMIVGQPSWLPFSLLPVGNAPPRSQKSSNPPRPRGMEPVSIRVICGCDGAMLCAVLVDLGALCVSKARPGGGEERGTRGSRPPAVASVPIGVIRGPNCEKRKTENEARPRYNHM